MSKKSRQSGMFAAVVVPETWTEEQLVARLVASHPVAWREFERRYDRLIERCILKVTRRFTSVVSADDVREIACTLRLSLLANDMHKLRTFDPERGNRFSSWIGLLAINCAYDYLRSIRREPGKAALTEASDLAAETPDPFESVAQRQRAQIAQRLLESFSARDRAFAALYFGEGLEPVAIARRMKISVKTVYSKKHKIQARLEAMQRAA
ncbi:MAG TPA: sigma-70 family RNA polymerase sigma factor [Polyangiaceae bacterium]|jgi:RNA polymerase sigma-70 factor (ECF subfamily)